MKSTSIDQYQAALELAIIDTDQILSTFSALMRISQVESGAQRSGFSLCDLSALIEKIATIYGPVAEDNGKFVSVEIAPGLLFHGDQHLLLQLFANIVENAITHTPKGTRIHIKAEQVQNQIVCTIEDDGQGIPPEHWPRLFERFYRVEDSRSTPGNGLGLALVAAVAELHRIEIEIADNKPGLKIALSIPA